MSELLALGVSHKTAPVALRERVALAGGERGAEVLRALLTDPAVHEAVAISTCNRTELYLATTDPVAAESAALGLLARQASIRPTELVDAIYSLRNCDAARQLYRVTAGLEAMIVGEAEIQGQVKRAYEAALAAGCTGPLTNRLFHAALATGKRARSETGIASSRLTVPSIAVTLAREIVGELRDRRAVVIGAGEMGEQTARALAEVGAIPVFVANRRRNRALDLARRYEGHAIGFDELPHELETADIVVASTSSPHAIVGARELELVTATRNGRPIVLIDIAVPRDIDPACAELPGVALYDMDDLQAVVDRNRSARDAEALRAEAIVEEEIARFARWLGTLEALPTLTALRDRGADIVAGVLADNAERWESLSPQDAERVELVARTVVNRLLHEPTVRLKRGGDRVHARLSVLRELFALDEQAIDRGTAGERSRTAGAAGHEGAEVRELPRRARR